MRPSDFQRRRKPSGTIPQFRGLHARADMTSSPWVHVVCNCVPVGAPVWRWFNNVIFIQRKIQHEQKKKRTLRHKNFMLHTSESSNDLNALWQTALWKQLWSKPRCCPSRFHCSTSTFTSRPSPVLLLRCCQPTSKKQKAGRPTSLPLSDRVICVAYPPGATRFTLLFSVWTYRLRINLPLTGKRCRSQIFYNIYTALHKAQVPTRTLNIKFMAKINFATEWFTLLLRTRQVKVQISARHLTS